MTEVTNFDGVTYNISRGDEVRLLPLPAGVARYFYWSNNNKSGKDFWTGSPGPEVAGLRVKVLADLDGGTALNMNVEIIEGPHKGEEFWLANELLSPYTPVTDDEVQETLESIFQSARKN